jgi:hypothetical protein
VERETGIEPASLAWKARVLPLNYSRIRELQQPWQASLLHTNHFINTFADTFKSAFGRLVEEAGFEPA